MYHLVRWTKNMPTFYVSISVKRKVTGSIKQAFMVRMKAASMASWWGLDMKL